MGEQQCVSSLARSRAKHLVADIYEAALRPTHWAVVLESLVAQFKAKAAALRTFEAMPETGGLWMTHGLERRALDEFRRYFQARNVWEACATARGAFKPGTVVTSDMLLPCRELQASEFYRGVHVLSYHYHWSEEAILNLSRRKRLIYLDLVANEMEARRNA